MCKTQNEFNKFLSKKNRPDFYAMGDANSSVVRIALSD